MASNYDFLRTFTFDGKETNHLFQIAKVNIPFLTKENEFYTVGNTDGKNFSSTRLGDHSITIDGFVIKDNTGKSVSDSMDELKLLINSDEPKKLIFDIFPDRYFNAIFSGTQEYDATNLEYTPLTLVFDVPDALAHSINSIGFSNVYTTGSNLMLDSEYLNTKKYMKQWVQMLDEKYDGSNIVMGDFTNGTPINFERTDDTDERWLNWNPMTMRHLPELKQGDSVNFSIFAQVVSIDEENKRNFAGEIVLEEWDSKESKILKRHVVQIPKKVSSTFVEYGSVVKIEHEKTNALNINYGFRGKNLIKWSKPMLSLLPPLGDTVVEPIAGATLYSNSLEWGDYDYSGNPNLLSNINKSAFALGTGAIATDGEEDEVVFTLDGSGQLLKYDNTFKLPPLLNGETYTMSCEIKFHSDIVGDLKNIRLTYNYLPGGATMLDTDRPLVDTTLDKWITLKGTRTVQYTANQPQQWYIVLQDVISANRITGTISLRNIKVEKGATATAYQPNLLQEPWQVSKVALNENIGNREQAFPINQTQYLVYNKDMIKPFVAGKTYTLTIKATKAPQQLFRVYTTGQETTCRIGDMLPVEGLADTWGITFTPTEENLSGTTGVGSSPSNLRIYQYPNSTLGNVKIDWLKIEEGDTATPPIDFYKYRGLGTFPSNNPHDYYWSYDPSYYRAITYVPSEEGIADVVRIQNNGTYQTKPKFSFRMNGENGLVALANQNGAILQFGNPEDVDGTESSRVEQGLNEGFWGNTLNPNIAVNTGFNSVYPNFVDDPSRPNLVQGTWNMTNNVDEVQPIFKGVSDIGVWHGPTLMMNIAPPSNGDRTLPISHHYRFGFNNYDKAQRGRIEFSTFDENGEPLMTAIVRDSDISSNEIVFEAWWKRKKLVLTKLDRKVFSKGFYEMNMDRLGDKLIWRLVQIKNLNTGGQWSSVTIDKEHKFTWTLEEPDTSQFMKSGVWIMRYSDKYHVIMALTDVQARWEGTPYYTDIENYFQDGDLVEINTATRELYVNGSVNNELNIVGNQWEQFIAPVGETIVQPIVSSWANMAEVTAEINQSYL